MGFFSGSKLFSVNSHPSYRKGYHKQDWSMPRSIGFSDRLIKYMCIILYINNHPWMRFNHVIISLRSCFFIHNYTEHHHLTARLMSCVIQLCALAHEFCPAAKSNSVLFPINYGKLKSHDLRLLPHFLYSSKNFWKSLIYMIICPWFVEYIKSIAAKCCGSIFHEAPHTAIPGT